MGSRQQNLLDIFATSSLSSSAVIAEKLSNLQLNIGSAVSSQSSSIKNISSSSSIIPFLITLTFSAKNSLKSTDNLILIGPGAVVDLVIHYQEAC